MYKPLQKKSYSYSPVSIPQKSKHFAKPGSSTVRAKPHPLSDSQELPTYSATEANLLAENVLRGMENRKQEQAQRQTLQPRWGLGGAIPARIAPPMLSTPQVQSQEVGIQRQCSDCAKEEQQQSGEEEKEVDEKSERGIQTKLTIGAPEDHYEQEADRVARQVMSVGAYRHTPFNSPQVQRFGQEGNSFKPLYLPQPVTPAVQMSVEEQAQMSELIQRTFQGGGNQTSEDLESRLNASKGGGSPLAPEVRDFMEPRFGADFSKVRVHTDGEAVQMNRELSAQAFTHGSDVYFGAGKSPGNNELTAHELTHVVQQSENIQRLQMLSPSLSEESSLIQCFSLSDITETAEHIGNKITDVASGVGEQIEKGVNYLKGRPERQRAERERPERENDNQENFCTAYTSTAEIYAAKTYLWTTLIPATTAMFGTDVAGLWQQYLSGPSSGYRTFAKGSNIANAFAQSNVIRQRTENLMVIATTRKDRFNTLPANKWVNVPVDQVFTQDEINYGINFSNPYDIPGHIAGGAGSSSFGKDTRTLKGYLSVCRETDDTGKTIGYQLKAKFEFEVKDTVDFCPGQPGSALEQILTIPASRLEASGQAFDVPFQVQFDAPEIIRTTKSPSPVSSSDRRHRADRQDVARILETASRH